MKRLPACAQSRAGGVRGAICAVGRRRADNGHAWRRGRLPQRRGPHQGIVRRYSPFDDEGDEGPSLRAHLSTDSLQIHGGNPTKNRGLSMAERAKVRNRLQLTSYCIWHDCCVSLTEFIGTEAHSFSQR
ncbi:hypothetical protein ABID25_006405 [Mesorhizobium abyssinicae]